MEMPFLEKVDFELQAQSVQPAQRNILSSTVTPPPIPSLSGLKCILLVLGLKLNYNESKYGCKDQS